MSFLVCRLLLVFPLGTPKPHNEYFSHNEGHNEAPSVVVCQLQQPGQASLM